jgi:hypothetical protein
MALQSAGGQSPIGRLGFPIKLSSARQRTELTGWALRAGKDRRGGSGERERGRSAEETSSAHARTFREALASLGSNYLGQATD